jgi:vancomycin aglycone glucosyltransferase
MFGAPINSHRASIGLSPVDDVRRFMFTAHPWLAIHDLTIRCRDNPRVSTLRSASVVW